MMIRKPSYISVVALRRVTLLAAALWFCAAFPGRVNACPYSLRDSAFIGAEAPRSYKLLFVVDHEGQRRKDLETWVNLAAEAWLRDAATDAKVIDRASVKNEIDLDALPSDALELDRLPTALLVAPDEDATVVRGVDRETLSQETVMNIAMRVVESPARAKLREHAVEAWCVVLLLKSDDASANQRAEKAIRAAADRITGTTTELGKVVKVPPYILSVAPDDPKERVLLWSLGVLDAKHDASWPLAVMLVGRGERRGPVFRGEEITEKNLYEALEMLGRSCSCTTAEMWLTGSMPPLTWGPDLKEAVRGELGFDPRDPEAVRAIQGVKAGIRGPAGFSSDALLGYRESTLQFGGPSPDLGITVTDVSSTDENHAEEDAEKTKAEAPPLTISPKVPTPQASQVGYYSLVTFIGLGVFVLIVLTMIMMRRSLSL